MTSLLDVVRWMETDVTPYSFSALHVYASCSCVSGPRIIKLLVNVSLFCVSTTEYSSEFLITSDSPQNHETLVISVTESTLQVTCISVLVSLYEELCFT